MTKRTRSSEKHLMQVRNYRYGGKLISSTIEILLQIEIGDAQEKCS